MKEKVKSKYILNSGIIEKEEGVFVGVLEFKNDEWKSSNYVRITINDGSIISREVEIHHLFSGKTKEETKAIHLLEAKNFEEKFLTATTSFKSAALKNRYKPVNESIEKDKNFSIVTFSFKEVKEAFKITIFHLNGRGRYMLEINGINVLSQLPHA